MEVVCKAVCGLGKASAPKLRHDISRFFSAKGVALCTPTKGIIPLEPELQTEILLFA